MDRRELDRVALVVDGRGFLRFQKRNPGRPTLMRNRVPLLLRDSVRAPQIFERYAFQLPE
jgi:hypothetical protein